MVREASDASGHGVGIFADLQGPKIRLGRFADGPVQLEQGAEFTITTRDVPGDVHICSTTYDGLPGDVAPGDHVLIDDGKVRLEVISVDNGTDVCTRVLVPGTVSNNKGINLPGVAVSVPALSEKDKEDLRWALHLTVDFIALSFVRSAADVEDVRRDHEGGGRLPPGDREDREAAGDREHRGHRRRLRRLHGRARRPRRGVPARGRAVPAEAGHRGRPSARQAGHRRDADARVDDLRAAADPRGGLRRRERRARRRRRRDAVRRDERGGVPHRDRADDGPDHRVHRGPRPGPDGGHRLAAAHPRRRDRQGRQRGRGADRREVPRRLHPER